MHATLLALLDRIREISRDDPVRTTRPGLPSPLDFTSYPWSHSLLAVVVWAILFAVAYAVLRRYPRGAWVCAAAVISHWILDLLTHRPDLPLAPDGSARVELGLWHSLPGTLIVELGIFTAGVYLYLRSTRALDRTGSVALWSLVIFLLVIYVGNIFGPPPPDTGALAVVGHTQWLLIIWAFWIDRHRTPNGPDGPD